MARGRSTRSESRRDSRSHRERHPRSSRGRHEHPSGRRTLSLHAKRAHKRAAIRDCDQRCVYCAVPLSLETATLDHVHPLSLGGANHAGNLVTACSRCNRLKGDLPPIEFFHRFPWAGANFIRYARAVHRALKRGAKRAVSLAFAA
ncbi:MAG: HNH endonuclease signature motif containing protein [Gemmatimonadaceae bacterium]|nr:HNH endonuclease signature motif containing protein [Gemmatimonadaceae bacterium]